MDKIGISEFFKEKEIFVTGGSGFLGKVLIEKLLRSCADLNKIYVLIRNKKGMAAQDRIEEILKNGLFDTLRQKNPDVLKKVVAISGDVSEMNLGLSVENRERLLGVQVVFHVAASVRFDDSIKKATLMNTRGTREVMKLLLEMRNLEVAVHVSTAYCNTDKDIVEERVYRDHGDWKEAIRLVEKYEDDHLLAILTPKCIGKLRNTYTYTKHLAENVVEDYSDRLPLVIVRPGVVISTMEDPIPGWIDNYAGPIGMSVAVGKGVLRVTFTGKDETLLDYMPVDVVIKIIITAAWTRIVEERPSTIPVYNCSVMPDMKITHTEMNKAGLRSIRKRPLYNSLWKPVSNITSNALEFRIKFFLFNALPVILLDALMRLIGKPTTFSKIIRKIYFGCCVISHFLIRNWDFKNDKARALNNKLKIEDREQFSYSFKDFDLDEFLDKSIIGCSKYLLKEPVDDPKSVKQFIRNERIYNALSFLFYGLSISILWIPFYLFVNL